MVDFIKAFKEGQNAAEMAKKNGLEIESIFEELNKQLTKATDGIIHIKMGWAGLSFMNHIGDLLEPDVEIDQEQGNYRGSYEIIFAENTQINSSEIEIAKWSKSLEGYPCKITLANNVHYCENKMSLEITLAEMLQDPIVGEQLSKLMQLPENKAA